MFVFLFYSIIVQRKILATLKKNEVAKIHKILLLIESSEYVAPRPRFLLRFQR